MQLTFDLVDVKIGTGIDDDRKLRPSTVNGWGCEAGSPMTAWRSRHGDEQIQLSNSLTRLRSLELRWAQRAFFVARMSVAICGTHVPGCRCAHPGYSPDARHRPVLRPATGHAGLPVPCSLVGACGTTGRFTAPAAPALLRASRMPLARHTGSGPAPAPLIAWAEPGLGSRSSPAFRTRMDFAACCMSPGIVAFADTCLVRADCRPDMHLDRPPDAPAFNRPIPTAPGRSIRNPRRSGPAS